MCIHMPVIDATIYIFKKRRKRYLYIKQKNKCEKMNVKSISERIKTKYMRENKNLSVKHYILKEKKKNESFFVLNN